jgi:hypothetical protein
MNDKYFKDNLWVYCPVLIMCSGIMLEVGKEMHNEWVPVIAGLIGTGVAFYLGLYVEHLEKQISEKDNK